jgi:hypothetical protein
MNQIENRVEDIIEPDMLDWDTGIEQDEDEWIDFLQTFILEDDLDEFIVYKNEHQIEAICAEGNIICADEMGLIIAD